MSVLFKTTAELGICIVTSTSLEFKKKLLSGEMKKGVEDIPQCVTEQTELPAQWKRKFLQHTHELNKKSSTEEFYPHLKSVPIGETPCHRSTSICPHIFPKARTKNPKAKNWRGVAPHPNLHSNHLAVVSKREWMFSKTYFHVKQLTTLLISFFWKPKGTLCLLL